MSVRKRKWTTAQGAEKEAWVVDYADQNGARRLKTFQRKKDADAFASTTHVAVREGTHVADRATVTVKQAGETWLKSGEEAGLERTTLDQYRTHLKYHINDPEIGIGSLKLSQLNAPTIRAFQDRLREHDRSPAMLRRVTVSLGSILADAQERGVVARNAVREMSRQKVRGKARQGEKRRKKRLEVGVDIPAPAETRAVVEHLKGRWRPILITAIFSGLRSSELRGLRWSDVDLRKNEIHVRQRADAYRVIGMPKSEAAQRTVSVSPIVANTLREWKLKCPKGDLDLIFPNGSGNIESHANIITRGLIPAMIVAGITVPILDEKGKPTKDEKGKPIVTAKYTGLHALRHFYASWCINPVENGGLGLDGKIVQERMGHSTLAMTMDTYGHLFPRRDDGKSLAEAERALLSAV